MTKKLRILGAILILQILVVGACVTNDSNSPRATVEGSPSPSPSTSPRVDVSENPPHSQLTLPVLDALLESDNFVSELKAKVQLSDAQLDELKNAARQEVSRLRTDNAEDNVADSADARSRATQQISRVIGEEKTTQLNALASDFWARNGEAEVSTEKQPANSSNKTPNSVPNDTRIVVNIPAYRMDLFKNGSLIKSYKIGIGYPQFPLPQGLRKAQTVIFNPTWTPPDSPWVATMKNITPGERVEAGSKLNPLGPIKIPIGMPSLIHGGKSPAKLGTFASHGCVGLTNQQVKDFARMLGQISGTDISEQSIQSYLKDPTQTHVVKLKQTVPVELRYETIVLEDGALHIYKDVYDQNTNTEENLRAVLEANNSGLEDLSDAERTEALSALTAMSPHPEKTVTSPTETTSTDVRATKQKRIQKKPGKNQKEVVVELKSLAHRGYPVPVNFDTGTGKPVNTASVF